MVASLLALALAAIPPASPLEKIPAAAPHLPGRGRVVQVTGARAYLDAGADDGLAPGMVLRLKRGEAEAGACTVEAVAPGHATCSGSGARIGDTFRVTPPAEIPGAKVATLPPVTPDEELASRAAAVASAPVVLVVDQGKGGGTQPLAAPRPGMAEVALTDIYWSSSDLTPYHVARLDAAVHGAPLGPFTVDVDMRGEYWLQQSPGATFLPGDTARFQLWQAQLNWAPPERALAVSAGRVLPWTIPGATPVDGALVGWRATGFTGGVYGGYVPQPDTTDFTTTRSTAGIFWSSDHGSGKGLLVRQEGRLAVAVTPELGTRYELEEGASAHAGNWLDLYAGVRLGTGGTTTQNGVLDAARLELSVRPLTRLWITAAADYGELLIPQDFNPPAWPGRSRHADGSVMWDFGPLRAGVIGGGSKDVVAGMERTWTGLELQVPRLFTPRVALSAGFQEEFGWLTGRSGWLQTVARLGDATRLIARISYSYQGQMGLDQDEGGLYLSGSTELTRHLGLRLSVLGRASVSGNSGSTPFGYNALLSVYALY
jgi:hypothetical protein